MRHSLSVLLLAAPLLCQSNVVPGTDIRIFDVGSPTVYGRRGPSYPNGEIALAIGHSMCNAGTVHIPWLGWQSGSGSVMLSTYPKIAFLVARDSGGRMVQVSSRAHMKHSRVAFNFTSGACIPCQTGPANTFRIGCGDVYSTGFNGNQFNLGPTGEIDPWQGTWNPVGSYFDRGDPAVIGPAATDGIQSLTTSGWDAFKNRMNLLEQELAIPGAVFWGQNQVSVIGEPGTSRDNNLGSRQLNITWNGSSWSSSLGAAAYMGGSVLNRWSGASVSSGRNGLDDGHFVVGVKVTGPVNGLWHYEYAIHNQDNARGGAAIRIPVCPTARVLNAGFRDIDTDALNQWTLNHTGSEIAFLGAANNPLDWNTIYNVWFDSDAAPVAGSLAIDEARVGPGALAVSVATQVPGRLGTEYLGAGCGAPAPQLFANGVPSSPNPGYALSVQAAPSAFVVLALAAQTANVPVATGCTLFVDQGQILATLLLQANGSGFASVGLPIPPAFTPTDIGAQALEIVAGGPVVGMLALSNGLRIRAGGTGCP